MIDNHTRAERSALTQPSSNNTINCQLLLTGTEPEIPAVEVEDPAEESRNQLADREDLDVEEIVKIESQMDDDLGHDTAMELRIDLLSLQHKLSKMAETALRPAISTADSTSSRTTVTLGDRIQAPSEGVEIPIMLTDPFGEKFAFPYDVFRTSNVSPSGIGGEFSRSLIADKNEYRA